MFHAISIEVLLALSYSLFLVLVAVALEFLAKHCHNRVRHLEIAGFRYHGSPDHWECPMGEKLHRIETDWQSLTVRYRAPAHSCNTCSIKKDCTRSDQGREIEQQLGAWLDSEVRRFHRGVSLALLFLAVLVLAIEAFRAHPARTWLLLTALAAITLGGVRLASWHNR
jgi:hypothetical protein